MITPKDLAELGGADVHDTAGERIGTVGRIYVDPRSGDPLWATVRTGSLGFQESFVPLRDARFADGRLTVAVDGERVRQAPLLDTDAPLGNELVDRLDAHYGLTPIPDDAMTRSEERLRVSTRQEPAEKVRLRRYLVTEERQITVPVTREEVRLERVPVTGDEPAEERADPGDDLILHAEQPVVSTQTVPVERVRLGKETVVHEETVTRPVRREKIEYEGPDR
jgi:stress response protein YsnF